MTFGDDFIRFTTPDGEERNICVASLDLEWPPPEKLELFGVNYQRISFSQITDEQREEMQFICRGAQYEPAGEVN